MILSQILPLESIQKAELPLRIALLVNVTGHVQFLLAKTLLKIIEARMLLFCKNTFGTS
jgi:hypothetical protein